VENQQAVAKLSLPLSQIALSTIDLRRSDAFWREGLGFLPSATSRMFRGPTISNLMRVEDAKTTTRWLVGQDEWLQIEIWQFENPVPRLLPENHAPHHIGFSRCGVWLKHFEATLQRLEAMGHRALSAPMGETGNRRVCVRDPDGIYVELLESDPLAGQLPPPAYDCDVALRSVTLTTPDLDASCHFAENGLGLCAAGFELHTNEHEQLWGLQGARCSRKTYVSAKMLMEVAQYHHPTPVPRHPHSRLIDQGILNIAFGESQSVKPIRELEDQTILHGALATERMVTPLGGCVYVTDDQGFSFELTWASPFLAQRVAGYFPKKSAKFHTADSVAMECQTKIDAPASAIWPHLIDPERINAWNATGSISRLTRAIDGSSGVGREYKVVRGRREMVMQVVACKPDQEIRYRLLRRGPFDNLAGEIRLQEDSGKTCVTWVVRFRGKWPLTSWLLKRLLRPRYQLSLDQLKKLLQP
jgi:catechol 2,3-dioxygenase-like lactoylglutathione lyase family enzyme/uncharacterized protein YndB with AHSA1/START domain